MTDTRSASFISQLLGLALGDLGPDAPSRIAFEGVSCRPDNGALQLGLRRLEAASLRLAAGPVVLEVGRLVLGDVAARVRLDAGTPRLDRLEAASAELHETQVRGPLDLQPPAALAGEAAAPGWQLAPLAAAEGTVRAQIVDAHLLFDADVTVPVRHGQIRFNDATVEHVGPDSRMGVSRLGLYVDAPNGRSYLYQFAAAPVAGVQFEQRGALLGPWVSDRGSLQLQPFAEGLLRQGAAGVGQGFTEQARQLLDRTALSGELRLGDGTVAVPGVQAELAGAGQGANTLRLHSSAVGRGVDAELPSLSLRQLALGPLHFAEATGSLALRLVPEAGQLRFALDARQLRLSGLRLQAPPKQGERGA